MFSPETHVLVDEDGDRRFLTTEQAERLIGNLQQRLGRIKDVVEIGIRVDGSHHKQWALAQIALEFGILDTDSGIAP